MGRPTKLTEYPDKQCLDCKATLPLSEFRRQICKGETKCTIYYSNACRLCLQLKHSPQKRNKESLDAARRRFRAKQKLNNACQSCGEKLAKGVVYYCRTCYVLDWMRKQKFYMKKQYNIHQDIQMYITDILALPDADKFPTFRLINKVAPSVTPLTVLTINDVLWSDTAVKHRLVKYNKHRDVNGHKKQIRDYYELAANSNVQWLGRSLPDNASTKTQWRCSLGHLFEKRYAALKQNPVCSVCAKIANTQRIIAYNNRKKQLCLT